MQFKTSMSLGEKISYARILLVLLSVSLFVLAGYYENPVFMLGIVVVNLTFGRFLTNVKCPSCKKTVLLGAKFNSFLIFSRLRCLNCKKTI